MNCLTQLPDRQISLFANRNATEVRSTSTYYRMYTFVHSRYLFFRWRWISSCHCSV